MIVRGNDMSPVNKKALGVHLCGSILVLSSYTNVICNLSGKETVMKRRKANGSQIIK